jgi:hypothetical protein
VVCPGTLSVEGEQSANVDTFVVCRSGGGGDRPRGGGQPVVGYAPSPGTSGAATGWALLLDGQASSTQSRSEREAGAEPSPVAGARATPLTPP